MLLSQLGEFGNDFLIKQDNRDTQIENRTNAWDKIESLTDTNHLVPVNGSQVDI